MRVLMVLLALVATPLLTGFAQSEGECKDKHANQGNHFGWRNGQHDDCNPPLGGISGNLFFDMSYDGVHDADETGLANWLVILSGPVNTSVMTDAAGNYSFTGLPAGTYTVCEGQRFGWIQTAPQGESGCTSGLGYTIVVGAGGSVTGLDFGNVG